MSKIIFVRASLTKTQYATNFLNKTKKKSINNPGGGENYVLTTQETAISCITAEQDFNYFLAKGCRNSIEVENSQLGYPFSNVLDQFTYFKHKGDISYIVKPGKITRQGLVLYGNNGLEYTLKLSSYFITENVVNPVIYLSVLNNPNNQFTLVPGIGSDNNNNFTISGYELKFIGSADYETKNSYKIRIRYLAETGYLEEQVTILVADVAEVVPKTCFKLVNLGCDGVTRTFFVCATTLVTTPGGNCNGINFFVDGVNTGSAQSTVITIVDNSLCVNCSN